MQTPPYDRMFEQSRRVYSAKGIAGDSHVRLMPPLDGLHGSLDVMVYGDAEFSLLGPNINATINLSEVKQSEWLGYYHGKKDSGKLAGDHRLIQAMKMLR